MSLAPVNFSRPDWSAVAAQRQPPAQPAPDLPTEPIQSADDLNREIEAQKESTLAYQLIKQLLIEQSSSESQTISIDTDDIDLNLSQSRSISRRRAPSVSPSGRRRRCRPSLRQARQLMTTRKATPLPIRSAPRERRCTTPSSSPRPRIRL